MSLTTILFFSSPLMTNAVWLTALCVTFTTSKHDHQFMINVTYSRSVFSRVHGLGGAHGGMFGTVLYIDSLQKHFNITNILAGSEQRTLDFESGGCQRISGSRSTLRIFNLVRELMNLVS